MHEGSSLGCSDGLEDGNSEGWLEGDSDGIDEGIDDGVSEGMLEGTEDGIDDGMEEGDPEGWLEGMEDGWELGFGEIKARPATTAASNSPDELTAGKTDRSIFSRAKEIPMDFRTMSKSYHHPR